MTNKIYRFAAFELDVAQGLLRHGESSIPLQDKPVRLLCVLLDHPQRLVTREQLQERMWDSRTVVNFEQGINVAIKKVRIALGDAADKPRFIETVAKKGYRFLVPVEEINADAEVRKAPPLALPQPETLPPAQPLLPSHARTSNRRGLALLVGLLCLAVAAIVAALSVKMPHDARYHSLAVLPLQNLSPDGGQDYLVDGITEELITSLAETLPLKVISRTSVMPYKRTDKSVRQIARELGVDAIVEGSVARSGDRVSVTVQLIDPEEDRHLWAQEYERRPEDLLAMESEVAHAIANRVSSTLTRTNVVPMTARAIDPAVYDLCLMGRYHWSKRTAASLAQARSYFEQALARDPNHAPAYVGLAEALAMSPSYGPASYVDLNAEATSLVRHAIALDENLAEAHAILGFLQLNDPKAWGHSEAEFRRALAIDPSLADAHHWIAYLLLFQDRREEAIAEIAKAQALDPMSAVTNADEAHFLYVMRDFDKARRRLERAIELEPELGQPHGTLALIELEEGHPVDAEREARTGLALDSKSPNTLSEAGYVLGSIGDTAEAKALFATLLDFARQRSAGPNYAALVAIGLGLSDQALELLKLNLPTNVAGLYAVGQWHGFDKIVADARYQQLLNSVR